MTSITPITSQHRFPINSQPLKPVLFSGSSVQSEEPQESERLTVLGAMWGGLKGAAKGLLFNSLLALVTAPFTAGLSFLLALKCALLIDPLVGAFTGGKSALTYLYSKVRRFLVGDQKQQQTS